MMTLFPWQRRSLPLGGWSIVRVSTSCLSSSTRTTKISPTKLPAGPKRNDIRKVTKRTVEKERATHRIQRADLSVSDKDDDVDQLAKKAKIDGMRSVINLKRIEAINTQIAVMERLENVYVARMGRDAYERKLVNLANKLPDMLEEDEQPRDVEQLTPQSATSDNDGTDLF